MKKDSFVMYTQWRELIFPLSKDAKAALLDIIFAYADLEFPDPVLAEIEGELEPVDKAQVRILENLITGQMERDAQRYEEVIAARRAAGKASGRSRAARKANST